jgi:hypothetical protein
MAICTYVCLAVPARSKCANIFISRVQNCHFCRSKGGALALHYSRSTSVACPSQAASQSDRYQPHSRVNCVRDRQVQGSPRSPGYKLNQSVAGVYAEQPINPLHRPINEIV